MIDDNNLNQLLREIEMASGGDVLKVKAKEIIMELKMLRKAKKDLARFADRDNNIVRNILATVDAFYRELSDHTII